MSRYRKVEVTMWDDAKFRTLSSDAQLLFLLMTTGPQQTMLGACRTGPAALGESLGWVGERLSQAFGEVIAKGMAKYDAEARLLWLPNFLKYNRPEAPNVVRAWRSVYDLLPESTLKPLIWKKMQACTDGMGEGFRKAFASLGEEYAYTGTGTGTGTGEILPPLTRAGAEPEQVPEPLPAAPAALEVPAVPDVPPPVAAGAGEAEWAAPSASDLAALEAPQCAMAMFEGINVPIDQGTLHVATQAIRLTAQKLATTNHAAMLLIKRRAQLARQSGEVVNRFWFQDCRYEQEPGAASGTANGAPNRASPAQVGVGPETHRAVAHPTKPGPDPPAGVDATSGEALWLGLCKGLRTELNVKSFETWVKPLKPLGVKDGVLYLRCPSEQFEHVPDKYGELIERFLPASVRVLKLLSAEVRA